MQNDRRDEPSLRVVLIGLRGVGKSTVGAALAAHLGVPFFDTDRVIEDRTGRSAGEWIREHGELAFRRVEAEVVADLSVRPAPMVLALGGGAPLEPRSRELLASWRVICLDAPDPVLALRLEKDRVSGVERPPLTDLSVLHEIHLQRCTRWADYMSMSPLVVSTTSDSQLSPEQLAEQLVQTLLSKEESSPE